jgi:hypothetical protein
MRKGRSTHYYFLHPGLRNCCVIADRFTTTRLRPYPLCPRFKCVVPLLPPVLDDLQRMAAHTRAACWRCAVIDGEHLQLLPLPIDEHDLVATRYMRDGVLSPRGCAH